jgi:CubicO group peptidase (beta-lactamase class C family)
VIANSYFEPPPWNAVLGPIAPRGGPNGCVTRYGRLVARWGDTRQVDMTFSVAKSYLSILAGIAYDRGLIPDVDEPVNRRIVDDAFAAPQNRAITWSHLLQQTSEWEGTLWGKPDIVDRNRDLSTEGGPLAKKGLPRPLQAPGTHWEYNDVRVNLLSLALLRLFRRPLPDVFAEAVMKPIGASAVSSASPQSFFAIGAGGNGTWIDPESGIVAVLRWLDPVATNEFIGLVISALVR